MALGRFWSWVGTFLAAFLYTSVGTLLTLFPWLPSWGQNYFSGSSRTWYMLWMNPYFRGAISGVGLLNLYISFGELLRLMGGRRR